jgi:AraC-like DNA-binding protein
MNGEIEWMSPGVHPEIVERYRFVPIGPGATERMYTILPDGYFDLVFVFSDTSCKVMLAGPFTRKTLVPLQDYELFIVRFRVGRLPRILDIKPAESINRMIEMPRVFSFRARNICDMLRQQPGMTGKRKLMNKILSAMELEPMQDNDLYCRAAAIVDIRGGQMKVGDLAELLCVSSRTLERQFKASLGITPKHFIRLVRFQNALDKLKALPACHSCAQIAYAAGYADQSHFVKDCVQFSELSPQKLVRGRVGL